MRRQNLGQLSCLSIALGLVVSCGAQLGDAPTPRRVGLELSRVGRHAVQEAMWEDGALEDHILNGIASGQPDWVEVGLRIVGGRHAHTNSMVVAALSRALPEAPTLVLRAPTVRVSLEWLCRGPGHMERIDDAWFEESIRVLESLEEPADLLPERDRCLTIVRESAQEG